MDLNYKSLGEGPKTLIILHGLFGSSDNWLTIGRQLSENYKIYILDQRNHGDSPHDGIHSYEAMANDLKEFIDKHAIKNPHFIGHSMGGKAAMTFAVTYPDLFDKLIIVDIAPKDYPVHHDQILEGLKNLDLTQVKTRGDADKQLAAYVPEQGVRQFLLKNLQRDGNKAYSWKINLKVLDESIEEISQSRINPISKEKPVLFIGGKNSNYIQKADDNLIKEFFPGAQIEMIADAGHWIHAEQPEAFLDHVQKFLQA
ncbi:MAG: esterase [Marivirga sp.]|jgi:esterase